LGNCYQSIGPWGRLFSAFWPIRKIFISLFGLEEDYYQLIIGSLSKKKTYIHFLISCDILQLVEEVFLYHVILYWLRRFLYIMWYYIGWGGFFISCDIILVEEVFLYHVILSWLRRFLYIMWYYIGWGGFLISCDILQLVGEVSAAHSFSRLEAHLQHLCTNDIPVHA
jgi:hypothetical protein